MAHNTVPCFSDAFELSSLAMGDGSMGGRPADERRVQRGRLLGGTAERGDEGL